MSKQVLIAGAGMGGLAAAIASARAGWQPRVFEQASAFTEAGAGIQLGPNATRVLEAWGLGSTLARVAAFPQRLAVRSAGNGDLLAQMPLGAAALERYGAPYATVHRADLHRVLLDGAREAGAELLVEARIERVRETADAVLVSLGGPTEIGGDALVGSDGLWSRVRQQLWADRRRRTGCCGCCTSGRRSRARRRCRTGGWPCWATRRIRCGPTWRRARAWRCQAEDFFARQHRVQIGLPGRAAKADPLADRRLRSGLVALRRQQAHALLPGPGPQGLQRLARARARTVVRYATERHARYRFVGRNRHPCRAAGCQSAQRRRCRRRGSPHTTNS